MKHRRFLLIQAGFTFLSAIAGVLFIPLNPVLAAPMPDPVQQVSVVPEASTTTPYVVNQNMRDTLPYAAQELRNWPSIISQSAVVIDLNTGTVLYAKNPLVRHYPASITKILTAMIALQKGHLNDQLVTSQLATEQGGNSVYLVPGEVEPLKKLLYGLLLNSGNDAAVVIAQHYGGSIQGFADMMNQEARSLGATHSHFVNPNGMPDPNHWTTAYDMALISKAAMQIPEFRKIVDTKTYNWKGQAWQSTLVNLNHMLFTYPGAIGVKTGFTDAAHETLVVAAKRGNQSFLAVLMDTPLDAQIRQDATGLLNFAFAHYQTQTLFKAGSIVGELSTPAGQTIPLVTSQAIRATSLKTAPLPVTFQLEKTRQPRHSMKVGTEDGQLQINLNGKVLGTVPVYLAEPYSSTPPARHRAGYVPLLMLLGAAVLALATRFALSKRSNVNFQV